jgi:Polyketide cyclase / dehydrase and lipid transport
MVAAVAEHEVSPVRVSARIAVPPDVLFAFVSDTRNDPLWCPNVEWVEMLEGDGVEVGSRFRFHQHLDRPGGKRIEFDAEVEVIELTASSVKWSISDRFQDREIVLTVTPDGDGSRISQVTKARFKRPPGLARWVYPLIARRTFRAQFTELERVLVHDRA